MQTFKDPQTNQYWQFDDHDDVRLIDGIYYVFDVLGNRMHNVPETLEPAELPPPEIPAPLIPQSITKAQGQAQLALEGKYQAVVDYIAAIADPTQRLLANIAFNSTNDWYLDSPFLNQMATDLGWLADPAYLDTFFINASAIKL